MQVCDAWGLRAHFRLGTDVLRQAVPETVIPALRVSVSSLDYLRYAVANDGNDQTYRLSLRRDKEATQS